MPTAEPCEVLVAEDQEHVREALAMLLRGKGYSVTLTSSPLEAITAAEQRPPDIALVDMNYQRDSTSGIEGLDLIERLRKVDRSLPVIALTAWGNVDLAVNAMKSGASDFIEKPWRNDSLLEKVSSLTSQARELRSSQRISDYERQDAQVLQTRIVPQRHIVASGIELFGDSIPAGVVGGDYFGAWQPSPDVLHFCVADVSGKGTPGAMIAAMLYASVSTLSSSSNRPESILRDVEKILQEQLGGGHYVTAFYGVLQLRTHELEYVNAGHCPPILRRGGHYGIAGADAAGAGLDAGCRFPLGASIAACRRPTAALHRWRNGSRQSGGRRIRDRATGGIGSRRRASLRWPTTGRASWTRCAALPTASSLMTPPCFCSTCRMRPERPHSTPCNRIPQPTKTCRRLKPAPEK